MIPGTTAYEDWRRERAGLATASMFKRILDAKTPRAWRTCLADIRSEAAAIEQGIFVDQIAAAIEWGRTLEPRAIATYALEFGRLTQPAPFVRHATLPVGCSPDALVDDDGLAEIKCPFSMDGFDRYCREKGEPAKWQCLGQLWLTGRAWCDLVVFDPRRADFDQLHVVRFTRESHADDYALLVRKVTEFAGYLAAGTEPEGSKFAEAA